MPIFHGKRQSKQLIARNLLKAKINFSLWNSVKNHNRNTVGYLNKLSWESGGQTKSNFQRMFRFSGLSPPLIAYRTCPFFTLLPYLLTHPKPWRIIKSEVTTKANFCGHRCLLGEDLKETWDNRSFHHKAAFEYLGAVSSYWSRQIIGSVMEITQQVMLHWDLPNDLNMMKCGTDCASVRSCQRVNSPVSSPVLLFVSEYSVWWHLIMSKHNKNPLSIPSMLSK